MAPRSAAKRSWHCAKQSVPRFHQTPHDAVRRGIALHSAGVSSSPGSASDGETTWGEQWALRAIVCGGSVGEAPAMEAQGSLLHDSHQAGSPTQPLEPGKGDPRLVMFAFYKT